MAYLSNTFAHNISLKQHESPVLVESYQVDFEPDFWLGLAKKGLVDCYSYALNLPEAGPNALGSIQAPYNDFGLEIYSPQSLHSSLLRDGLDEFKILPQDNSHIIFLCFGEKVYSGRPGYLAYRRDRTGIWSYLYGKGDCTHDGYPLQNDFSGKIIHDPLVCDRGPYNKAVGFFAYPYGGLVFRPKLQLPTTTPFLMPK